ncbi:MAG: LexA family transcriptional regulator [Planctomycetes bacterium]|nr:LexA family transcriptional regulator [Planctomycetota bacterium]
MQIGRKIRALRKAKDMNQTALGNLLGISQRYISDLESGKLRVKPDMLARIAAALQCPTEELMLWSSPEDAAKSQAAESAQGRFILPLRGTVPFSRFFWPERTTSPAQLVSVPDHLYEGQRVVLRAGDDSMEPEIRLNDLCIIDPMLRPTHGSIACCQIGDEQYPNCTIRWYLDTEDAIVLQPERTGTPDLQPIVLVRQRGGVFRYLGEETTFEVRGVLVGVIRTYALPQ